MTNNLESGGEFWEFEGYLGPRFEEDKHQVYVDRLLSILADRRCHNIALTGEYGTGKSSIIRGLEAALTSNKLSAESKTKTWLSDRLRKYRGKQFDRRKKDVAKSVESLRRWVDDLRKINGVYTGDRTKSEENGPLNERDTLAGLSSKLSELEYRTRELSDSVDELLTRESKCSLEKRELLPTKPIVVSLASFDLDNSDSNEDLENRLQREIVKQLIFREDPLRMRKSSFRRIIVLPRHRKLLNAMLAALIILISIAWFEQEDLASSWLAGTALTEVDLAQFFRFIITWAGLTILFAIIDWAFIGRLRVKGISAGPARLELAEGEESYFDKFLVEIIYYFEISNVDLVILEDLDRHHSPGIFESLRELNQQINLAIRGKRKQPVRFLYTTKDSIFVETDDEDNQSAQNEASQNRKGFAFRRFESRGNSAFVDESARRDLVENEAKFRQVTNRTKFFDAIVPVLPIFSHSSTSAFLNELILESYGERFEGFGSSHVDDEVKIDRRVIEIICRYAKDYRLLRNIASEFLLFEQIRPKHDRSFEELESSISGQDKLLALVGYKNIEIEDYQKSCLGDCSLDYLFKDFDRVVDETRKQTLKRIQDIEGKLSRDVITEAEARNLDRELLESLKIGGVRGVDNERDFFRGRLFLNGKPFNAIGGTFLNFWVAACGKNLGEIRSVVWASEGFTEESVDSGIKQKTLQKAKGILRENGLWKDEHERKIRALESENELLTSFLKEIRDAGIASFLEQVKKVSNKSTNDRVEELEGALQKNIKSDFLCDLIRLGFIDRDFRFYLNQAGKTRTVSRAQQFIAEQIERNSPNMEKSLDRNDLVEIVRFLQEEYFLRAKSGALNIDLLLYLSSLSAGDNRKQLVGSILGDVNTLDVPEKHLESLISGLLGRVKTDPNNPSLEKNVRYLFSEIVKIYPGVLSTQVYEIAGREAKALVCTGVLEGLGSDRLSISHEFLDYLAKSSHELEIFCVSLGNSKIERAATELRNQGVIVSNIAPMSPGAKSQFLDLGIVEITKENLEEINRFDGAEPTLVEMSKREKFFEQLLQNRERYCKALEEIGISTVREVEIRSFFPEVLNKIHFYLGRECSGGELTNELSKLLDNVEEGVICRDASGLDKESLRALIAQNLLEFNVENLYQIICKLGKIDDEIWTAIEAGGNRKIKGIHNASSVALGRVLDEVTERNEEPKGWAATIKEMRIRYSNF